MCFPLTKCRLVYSFKMASRTGPRAGGSDGSDFTHRQRIASHYVESVRLKSKLKFSIGLHLMLVVCVAVWTGLALVGKLKVKPSHWEMTWLLSTIPALIGLASLPKNNVAEAYMYALGTMITGIAPLTYGASNLAYEVLTNMKQGRAPATQHWQNLPVKIALVAFIIQIHGIGIYFAYKLIAAWGAKGEKKLS